tara:strand:- start:31 stop:522 length:492 start_codon:yes stop_codon:yes gene_type:complete
MQLYKQTGQMQALQKQVEDGELTEEQITDTLEGMKLSFNDKAINIIEITKNSQPFIDGIDAEIKRLSEMKRTIQANNDRLKNYLRVNMVESGISKIESPTLKITLGKPTVTAEIVDVDFLPDEFLSVKTEIKPDKKAILKALKEGVKVDGAVLATGKASLRIK